MEGGACAREESGNGNQGMGQNGEWERNAPKISIALYWVYCPAALYSESKSGAMSNSIAQALSTDRALTDSCQPYALC
jgi:hypothetical protein